MISHDEHGPVAPDGDKVVELVTTKSDAEIVADLKRRFEDAIRPALAIMDEAARVGLQIQFDGLAYGPPFMCHRLNGLRVVKVY